jgi:hypothetical protein
LLAVSRVKAQAAAVTETDEGIATEALATFHALEQKAGSKRRELKVRRYWRIEIARNIKSHLHHLLSKHGSQNKKTHLRRSEMGSGAMNPKFLRD